MYNFPVIRHIDDLLEHVNKFDYIHESHKKNGTRVVCYIYTDKDSFSNEWERECRGITFDKDGWILSRTIHKFFNLGEKLKYMPNKLDFSKVKAIFPKLDGSMISTYLLDNVIVAKSKNSEASDVALLANDYIKRNPAYIEFCTDLSKNGQTPTFEYTSPTNRIVVKYDEEELTLLQVRENVTGKYLDIHEISKKYDIKVLDSAYSDVSNFSVLVEDLALLEGIEGVIVMFEDGDMVKIKTPWYVGLHHSVTFKRYRDIARLVLSETLDDFRGFLYLQKYDAIDFNILDQIETDILMEIKALSDGITCWSEKIKEESTSNGKLDYKKATILLKEYSVDGIRFNFVMNEIRGVENDYLDYYKRNILKEKWSLDVIPAPKSL